MKTTQTVRVVRDGKITSEETLEGSTPDVRDGDPTRLLDMRRMPSVRAGFCVYCGSTDRLSREHVVPYALGGTLTITEGSCESCREKTHRFETDVLTGPMRMVRFVQNLPSRSNHQSVATEIDFRVTLSDGSEDEIRVPIAKAPILLAFYEFGEPKYLDASRGAQLECGGTVTGSYGRDPRELLSELAAKGMTITSLPARPVAFARMIAKIAYCFAWANGHIDKLEAPIELVSAFMGEPETLGRFVGSISPPYTRYEGVGVRFAIKVLEAHRVAFAEVQLFASIGAPTYVVALGKLKDGEMLIEPPRKRGSPSGPRVTVDDGSAQWQ